MQVKSTQPETRKLASRRRPDSRTLAQKRRDLIAQVEHMALSDLAKVSKRLKDLHAELDRLEGGRVTYYALSEAVGVAHRTLQSWENGEVENRDGKGYDKLARYYSKKLGRKITRQWILFGDEVPPQEGGEFPDSVEAAAREVELRAELAAVKLALEEQRSLLERVLHNQESGS